jgi:hypothetical protein
VPSTLELRFREFAAWMPARRAGVIVLALSVLIYLALITPEVLHSPSRRRQIVLIVAWCLGISAIFMLVRLWRHISREGFSAPRGDV